MQKKQQLLIESGIKKIVKNMLMESTYNFDREESYALYKLVQYAINKRISQKITGLDYTRMMALQNKIEKIHSGNGGE